VDRAGEGTIQVSDAPSFDNGPRRVCASRAASIVNIANASATEIASAGASFYSFERDARDPQVAICCQRPPRA